MSRNIAPAKSSVCKHACYFKTTTEDKVASLEATYVKIRKLTKSRSICMIVMLRLEAAILHGQISYYLQVKPRLRGPEKDSFPCPKHPLFISEFPWLVCHRETDLAMLLVRCERSEGLFITDKDYGKLVPILAHGVNSCGN